LIQGNATASSHFFGHAAIGSPLSMARVFA
jgi:hypothetical protein